MKSYKRRPLTSSIIAFLLVAFVAVAANNVYAQNRKKIEQGNLRNWKWMIHKLHLKLPENLPPPAKDPNRPKGTFQKKGSNNWYDSAGNTYVRSAWGTWNNYDEAKANPYPNLPNPLIWHGKKITSTKTWWTKKRPQIKKDFSEEIYGKIPKHVPGVDWKVVSTRDTTIGKIAAIVKHVNGHVNNSSDPSIKVNIKLIVVTPAHVNKPVPVIMHLAYMLSLIHI